MKVELTKEMAVALLKGVTPVYDDFYLVEPVLGTYSDQYGRFYWKEEKLKEMTIEQLYNLYNRLT
jgi:hypothetical protein